jgi:succinyl-diaminopimelate desuccinylase
MQIAAGIERWGNSSATGHQAEVGKEMTRLSDPVELTRRLIAFDTINPPGRERACMEFLEELLRTAGFETSLVAMGKDRANLVATKPGSGTGLPLVFTGHIDVVPLGARKWRRDPFGGEIVGDLLFGRGSSDMKGGVAAFVLAAIAESSVIEKTSGIKLIITAGEETGCDGAKALLRDTPLGRAGALVVAEPTANVPYVGHKGALWLKAVASGITAHGSMPDRGDNAVYKAARAVVALSNVEFDGLEHPSLGKVTLNVGTLHGGLNINSVPDRAEIGIDIRTIPEVDHERLRSVIAGKLEGNAEVEVLLDLPGIWTSPQLPWPRRVAELTAGITGAAPGVRSATYFTDASVLSPALGRVPTLILGPGEPTQAHQTDEWCEVPRIQQAVTIYREIIADWARHESATKHT